ncbi:MAG: hypothetical protein NTV81_01600 [Candidatus Komeilibacteria bacterium]|nr:hypothetical protein [Candidatus Komeilibacteria bacterium]
MKKRSWLSLVWVFGLSALPWLAQAQLSTGLELAGSTGLATADPKIAILNIIRIALGFLGLIAVVIMVVGGFKWMTAQGADDKIKQAKKTIINGLIGLVIVLSAFLIVSFVINRIGGQLTANQGNEPGGPGNPGGPGGFNNDIFRAANITPPDQSIWPNRDVAVKVRFNFPFRVESIPLAVAAGQLKVYYQDSLTKQFTVEVLGTWSSDGLTGLDFVPQSTCLVGTKTFHCFDKNSQIKIQISDRGVVANGGLVSTNGKPLKCDQLAANCSSVFTVGDKVFGEEAATAPIIDLVDPGDGAADTWVTIWGRNFGSATGTVKLILDGNVVASLLLPQIVGCQNQWGESMVMVNVPNVPLKQYRIKLITSVGKESNQAPFTVNTLKRPGLCLVEPSSARAEDALTLKGKNLAQNPLPQTVVFGDQLASETAPVLSYAAGQVERATVSVPNLNQGLTTVRYKLGEALSNGRSVKILGGQAQQLKVRYLTPVAAPAGSYVTIFGQGFGNGKTANRHVLFMIAGGGLVEADYDFPASCSSDFWQNDQIIVKVPPAASAEPAAVVIDVDGQQVVTEGDNLFRRTQGTPIPGVCSLRPTETKVGQVISLTGDNFLGGEQSTTSRSNGINFKIKAAAAAGANGLGGYFDWNFRTCDGCKYPEVKEMLSCDAYSAASPAPKQNALGVPLDLTDLGVYFNTAIQTPNSNQAVAIEQCGQGSQFSAAACAARDWPKDYTVIEGGSSTPSKLFITLMDEPAWQANTWYQITINHEYIRYNGDGAWPMQEDYAWHFKTGAANEMCRLNTVSISPNNYRAYLGEEKAFYAQGQDVNCNLCRGQFNWSLDNNDARASIAAQQVPNGLFASVSANALASATSPVVIRTVVVNNNSVSSTAKLVIEDPSPRLLTTASCLNNIASPTPTGNEVCLNSMIAARFVLPNGNDANLNRFSAGAIRLTKGEAGQACSESVNGFNLDYLTGQDNQIIGFTIQVAGGLAPDTHYCVELVGGQQGILSLSGVPLSGQHTWEFTTNNGSCDLKRVIVNPNLAQFRDLQQSRPYRALVVGNNCQVIDPAVLTWTWQKDPSNTQVIQEVVGQGNVATVTSNYWGQAHVLATASNGQAAIHNDDNNGLVIVSDNFSLTNVYPATSPTCRNALLGVKFNLSINQAAANLNKLKIYQPRAGFGENPSEENLANFEEVTNQFSPQVLNSGLKVALIRTRENGLLAAGQTYWVFVPQAVSSSLDLTLSENACGNVAIPARSDGVFRGCWFRATTNHEVCQITRASINPASSTLQINGSQQFSGEVFGTVGNLELQLGVPFNWNLTNEQLVEIVPAASRSNSYAVDVFGRNEGNALLRAVPAVNYQTSSLPTAQAAIMVSGVASQPQVYSFDPELNRSDVCPNRLMGATFDQLINPLTLNQQTVILEARAGLSQIPWYQRWYRWLKALVGVQVYASNGEAVITNDANYKVNTFSATTRFNANTWQAIPIKIQTVEDTVSVNGSPRQVTRLLLTPSEVLPTTARIRIRLLGGLTGILNLQGLTLDLTPKDGVYIVQDNSIISSFSTRSTICALNHVTMDPVYHLFTRSQGELATKEFTATAHAIDGQALVSVDDYSWSWQWFSSKEEVARVNSESSQASVQAQNYNGRATITAIASTTRGIPEAVKQAGAVVDVDLCENPWPAAVGTNLPIFQDIAFNFSLRYCRDAGRAHDVSDDLPALSEDNSLPAFDPESIPGRNGLLREYLVGVPDTGDVIGLRIYQNPAHLLPLAWYKELNPIGGKPQGVQVDGYPAIKDGSTFYVGATNLAMPGVFNRLFNQQRLSFNSISNQAPWWKKILAYLRLIRLDTATAATTPSGSAGCQLNSDGSALICCEAVGTGGIISCGSTPIIQCQNSSSGLVSCPQTNKNNCAVNSTTGSVSCPQTNTQALNATTVINSNTDQNGCQIDSTTGAAVCTDLDAATNGSFQSNAARGSNVNTVVSAAATGLLFGGNPNVFTQTAVTVRGSLSIPEDNFISEENIQNAEAYTTVFLLSYNQGAVATTTKIVERLLNNVRFNLNLNGNTNLQDKVVRDWQRVRDLTAIEKSLADYYALDNRHLYPILGGGSYVSGMSVSVWPSWAQTLSTELKQALPTDPLNTMNIGPEGLNEPVCVGPAGDQANTGFEAKTCWNAARRQFACTNRAYFYGYEAKDRGTNYDLVGRLETTRKWPNEEWIGNNMAIGSLNYDDLDIVPFFCEHRF